MDVLKDYLSCSKLLGALDRYICGVKGHKKGFDVCGKNTQNKILKNTLMVNMFLFILLRNRKKHKYY